MTRWIAEGGKVFEEGGEVDNWICECREMIDGEYYEGEDYDRVAQLIADEHNALEEIGGMVASIIFCSDEMRGHHLRRILELTGYKPEEQQP